ncbi:MAG TPA: DUF5958 family protein [Polyangiaceae bacterium]
MNRSELEIRLNRLAQKSLALEEGRAWFLALNEAEVVDVLRSLAAMVQQAHPAEDEVASTITESGIERTHTAPSLLLRSDPLKTRLSKLTGLRGNQGVEGFVLLVLLLGIADGRRRRTACAQGCSHWWHSDLGQVERRGFGE